MRITALETIQLESFPNIIWLEVHTDEGLVGLGETFRGAHAVAAHIHHSTAPYLLGQDPLAIDRHSAALLGGPVGFIGNGVETRAASAVDIALWDLFGKSTGLPIHQLLGGASRDRIPVYNTCSGYRYNSAAWKRTVDISDAREGPYDDQIGFVTAADELALSLLDEGYTAMKIWPFDVHAEVTGGLHISVEQIREGLIPFEKIRNAVGDRMEVMAEFHGMWRLPAARQIAAALRDVRPYWLEDPIRMTSVSELAEYAAATDIKVCASETMATRTAFRDLLESRAASVVMLDLGWCGGLSEARKIASAADTYQRPIAPHDCTGPIVLAASIQLGLNAPNTLYQEVVRAYLAGWYRELVEELPKVSGGYISPVAGPGHGMTLQADLKKRPDAIVRRTDLTVL